MTSLRRIEGWEGRLADFVAQAVTRPFLWGDFDCCLMPCEAVQVITGADPAGPLRGRYRTARGALRVLKGYGGGGLVEAAEKIAAGLEAPEVPVNFARRGDVLLITGDLAAEAPGFDALLGLCLGREAAFMMDPGLRFIDLQAIEARAWAVG